MNSSIVAEKVNEGALKAAEARHLISALKAIRKSIELKNGRATHSINRPLRQKSDVRQVANAFLIALRSDPSGAIEHLPKILAGLSIEDRSCFAALILLALFDADPGMCRRFVHFSIQLLLAKPSFNSIDAALREKNVDLLLEIAAQEDSFITDPLLLRLLKNTVIPNIILEKLFTRLRKALLCKIPRHRLRQPRVMQFLSALAQQCFLNEFVYYVSEEELAEISRLTIMIEAAACEPQELEVALSLIALYQPLTDIESLPALQRALGHKMSSPLEDLMQATVEPYRLERVIRRAVVRVGKISERVSVLVANQYEENPYPRWATMERPPSNSARKILSRHFDEDEVNRLPPEPSVLIAGCGTGRHSISAALRYGDNARVIAVDLSANSLAYAIRKSREYNITNVEYRQMDLLDLAALDQSFDVIECVGVIHHMKDPLEGWRILTDHLRPDGLMKIGVYSAIARLPISYARKALKLRGVPATPDMMRSFRQKVIASADQYWSKFIMSKSDFYSLSDCRDLLFHVQEHFFSISMIERALKDLGLAFRGFELRSDSLEQYRKKYPDDTDMRNLANWGRFELERPNTFADMYNFWCYKRSSSD